MQWLKFRKNEIVELNPYENMETFIHHRAPKKEQPILVVKNLKQSFKKHRQEKVIFENINFKFYANERIAFLGPNGSGKTTMISTICGIYEPKVGTIEYNFAYIKTPYEAMSVQFQDLQFPNALTPNDLIEFAKQLSNNPISDKEIAEAKEIFGIKNIANTKISKLSGGQQQRINVFISMLSKPKILILDEFTTGLDIAIKNRIQNYIKFFCNKYKITLVLISHDLDTIEELAERVIILADKRIMVDASKKTITKYFGSMSKMIKKYIII